MSEKATAYLCGMAMGAFLVVVLVYLFPTDVAPFRDAAVIPGNIQPLTRSRNSEKRCKQDAARIVNGNTWRALAA